MTMRLFSECLVANLPLASISFILTITAIFFVFLCNVQIIISDLARFSKTHNLFREKYSHV